MKLLFFDIDGTLAMPGNAPSPATVEAIRACRRKGHKVFISTGRTQKTVPEAINEIGFDGGIYSAGGRIVVDGKEIWQDCMSPKLVKRIISVMEKNNINYTLECENGLFDGTVELELSSLDNGKGSSELQRVMEIRKRMGNRHPVSEYNNEPVYKITFMITSRDHIDILKKDLENDAKVVAFDNLLKDASVTAGEVSDFNINKGFALEYICKHFNTDVSQSIAFGDSMNDSEILIQAGLGIAVDNSSDEVKAIADMVCDSCENDGVAKMLKKLGIA